MAIQMRPKKKLERKYLPQKINSLRRLARRLRALREHARQAGESVVCDISDGWSTGDPLTDFVLVDCDGEYDEDALAYYRQLHDLVLLSTGRQAIIAQQAECWYESEVTVIRTITLIQIRSGAMEFDTNKGLIGIPTVKDYYIRREFFNPEEDEVRGVAMLIDGTMAYAGPLASNDAPMRHTRRNKQGLHEVPVDTPFDLFIHPWDTEMLFQYHGIDQEMLKSMHEEWMRMRQPRSR